MSPLTYCSCSLMRHCLSHACKMALVAVSNTQRHRAAYAAAALQLLTPAQDAAARAAVGSKDVKLKKRLIGSLTDYHALVSPAKRGPASKFTSQIMDAARELIIEPEDRLWTGPSIIEQLQEDGWLAGRVNVDNFLKHLKARCKELNEVLCTNSTGTIFLITEATKAKRLAWCKKVEELLISYPLASWVFEDETGKEQNPHPKGTWSRTLLFSSNLG